MYSLKRIVRSLWRYKSFSIINFLGLSIGIAAIMILFLIANYEKSFDKLHSDRDNIYRVVGQREQGGDAIFESAVPYPTAKFLRAEYSGVIATQINFDNDRDIKIGDQAPFAEKNIVFADSLFFKVMDYSSIKNFWLSGNPADAMTGPNKAVLTESTAKKYFGNVDPVGKTFRISNKADVTVVGLVKDIPTTTHLPANLFISFATLTKDFMAGIDLDNWDFTSNGYCYIKLPGDEAVPAVTNGLNAVIQKNAISEIAKKRKFSLQPISAIHFDEVYSSPNYTVSSKYLQMLLLLGVFILLIACINYVNLSTSLAFLKSKEIGIRKTIGASRKQLFFYYLTETLFITSVATIIGIGIVIVSLPYVNQLLDKSIELGQLLTPKFVIGALLSLVVMSFLSGAYPAIVLSGFNPILSLKNQFIIPKQSSAILRKSLVIFQFTTSIVLIICTIVIARQVNYFKNKSLGFNKEAVLEVGLPESDSTRIENFRVLLQNQAGIRSLSFCLGAPVSDNGLNTSFKAPELSENTEYNIKVMPADKNYLQTYDLKLLAGRWFFPSEEKNLGTAVVINEATAKQLGYKPSDAIGKKITIGLNSMSPPVIGVVKDFHTNSLHKAITAACITPFPYFYYAAGIRVDPNNVRQSLSTIESAFRKVYPNDVYTFNFIDETLAKRYDQENRDYSLFKAFAVISIFICCIGLWGLIAFVVVRKTKEIGIRKVLGASATGIVGLLSKDFLRLVIIALVIASPVAWYFMNRWLENFVYRIDISWWMFLLAGVLAILIAVLTISFQAIRAAVRNPVKSLRTE